MKKQKTIFIISVLGLIFLFQKNGFCQNGNSFNQINSDKDSIANSYNANPNGKPSKMLLSADKEGPVITNQNNNGNSPNDSVTVVSDFIISNEKDPQKN